MVGQKMATKPNRSDEVLEADEQLKIANQIRAQFDSAAPMRPIKPNRSEPNSSSSSSPPNPVDYSIVETQHSRARQVSFSPVSIPYYTLISGGSYHSTG